MRKLDRVLRARSEIEERWIRATLDQLVETHTEAMEQHVGRQYLVNDHIWSIGKIANVWSIVCTGKHDMRFRFVTHVRDCPILTHVCEVHSLRVDAHPSIAAHQLLMSFVSHYTSVFKVDGSLHED